MRGRVGEPQILTVEQFSLLLTMVCAVPTEDGTEVLSDLAEYIQRKLDPILLSTIGTETNSWEMFSRVNSRIWSELESHFRFLARKSTEIGV